jgi:PAS domain S-box-containing protein
VPESSSPTSTAAPGADVRDPPDQGDRYRVILDSVVEAIIVFDPVTYAIEEVNRGTCELLAKTRDELIGHSFTSVLKPAEAARLPAIISPLVSGERAASTVMLGYLPAHGRPAAVEVVLQAVDLPGSSRAIVAIARMTALSSAARACSAWARRGSRT